MYFANNLAKRRIFACDKTKRKIILKQSTK
jgi:hypothetical protein